MIENLTAVDLIARVKNLEVAGDIQRVLEEYRAWLRKNPNLPESFAVWYEYARALLNSGSFYQAENGFKAVLEQKPMLTEAMLGVGSALEGQGKVDEAMEVWKASLGDKKLRCAALNNIARISEGRFEHDQAEDALLQSIYIDPDQPEVLTTLLGIRQKLCRWPLFTKELPVSIQAQKSALGPLASMALEDDAVANLEATKRFVQMKLYERGYDQLVNRGHCYEGHKKIRLGFLSSDFRLHATSIFFAQLLENIDRNIFEVYGFDITTINFHGDYMQPRLIKAMDHHIQLQSVSDLEAARKIRDCEIDVLIDLTGLTSSARPEIMLRRPAPIQVAYLGFLSSSCMSTIDYVITTKDLHADMENGFTEKPLFLPSVYATIDVDLPVAHSVNRAECGLPEDGFVFCALLNPYKITQEIFEVWMRILIATPSSVLWLISDSETQKNNLLEHAKTFGVGAERFVFSTRMQPDEYRAKLAVADLFLDTTPYGNGATAHDALVANLPILTRPGSTMISRLSAHFMNAVGLKEFVVSSLPEYEKFAIMIASDRKKLIQYRECIANSRAKSPLFDRHQFASDFGEIVKAAIDGVA